MFSLAWLTLTILETLKHRCSDKILSDFVAKDTTGKVILADARGRHARHARCDDERPGTSRRLASGGEQGGERNDVTVSTARTGCIQSSQPLPNTA